MSSSGGLPVGSSIAPRPSVVVLPETPTPPSLLDFLAARFPQVGRATWRQRLATGKVLGEDGLPVGLETAYRPRARLFHFREVAVENPPPREEEILFRDEDLLVADKPHFMPVTPGGGTVNECLLYRLRRRTGLDALVPVHRLDRKTAGLVLFSVRRESRAVLTGLFVERRVKKEYRAVAPVPVPPARRSWSVESRLVPGEPPFRMRRAAGEPNARSRIELLELRGDRGLFALEPETGRRHQLRVHMAELGFPILHERCYPLLLPEAPDDHARPLQLLARRLRFAHPVTGEPLDFASRQRLREWG